LCFALAFFFSTQKALSGATAPLCFYKSFEAGNSPFSIHGADIDGDGLVDLIVGNMTPTDNLRVFKNAGDRNFELIQTHTVDDCSALSVYTATLNDDQRADLAAATGKDSLAFLVYDGQGGEPFNNTVYCQAGPGCFSV